MFKVRFACPTLIIFLYLISALLIPIFVGRIHKPIPLSKTHIKASSSYSLDADPISFSPAPKPPSLDMEDHKSSNYSFIRNLLSIRRKVTLFESYRLRGLLIHGSAPQWGSALIEDLTTGKSSIFFLNDVFPDRSRLVDMRDNFIVLEKDGIRKTILIFPHAAAAVGTLATAPENSGYHKINANEWSLNPYQYFNGDVSNILNFSITLNTKGNRTEGLRINDVNNSALIGQLGIEEGDIILEVNDVGLNSLYKCFKAYFDASISNELQLKVLRGGTTVILKYHLSWEGKGTWTTEDVMKSRAMLSLLNGRFAYDLF
jgi:hypothetical protein